MTPIMPGKAPDPLVNYHEEYSDYRSTSRRFEFADLVRFAQEHLSGPASAGRFGQDGVTWLDFAAARAACSSICVTWGSSS